MCGACPLPTIMRMPKIGPYQQYRIPVETGKLVERSLYEEYYDEAIRLAEQLSRFRRT